MGVSTSAEGQRLIVLRALHLGIKAVGEHGPDRCRLDTGAGEKEVAPTA
jgi:hypothetical protein